MKRLVVLASFFACGPKPAPVEVATLPTDGNAHTAKPTGPAKPVDKDAWTGRTDLISAPPPPSPTALPLPGVSDFKLANGLQVYVIKNDRLPTVSFALAMKAGRNAEPRARLGVSEATADMLVKGTKKHDAIGLAKAIDFVGGTIGADSTFEATLVTCSVLTRNRSTCLDLVPEMITQSTFPDPELSKVKDNMILSVRARLDNAEQLASANVQNLLWGPEHVRGWVNSEGTITALKRDEIVQWAKTWYVPNNAILVVAGDVDDKAIKGEIERAFGSWKKQDLPPVPAFKDPTLSGIRIRLVDKPGQTQTHIRIAQYGIKHDDARFFDTLVWNYALGGGTFGSRLMKVVRVQGGKTYGASSAFDRNMDKGSFVAQTFTRNSEALATTKLLLGEIGKMQKEGPSADEVQAAVANIAGGYALRFQSANDFGSALVGAELHNFGTEYLTNYPVQVAKVDADAAKRAAAEILDTRNYVLVWVGDAKDLEPQLKKEGWRYEKVAFTDPLSDVKEEAPAPLQGPQALAAAKQTLADALKVKGGAKVTAIKELHMLATGSTVIQGQTFPVEISREFVLPDKMRIDANIAKKMMVTVVVDGNKGWESAPDQKGASAMMDLQGNDMAAAQFEQWREAELILVKANDPAAKLTPLADDKIDGKDQTVVQLQSPYKLAVTIFIDKKTKLITRMTYSDAGQTETDDFADYRDSNGIKVAYKRNSTTSGRATNLTLDKVEINHPVPADFFAKPAKP